MVYCCVKHILHGASRGCGIELVVMYAIFDSLAVVLQGLWGVVGDASVASGGR